MPRGRRGELAMGRKTCGRVASPLDGEQARGDVSTALDMTIIIICYVG